MFNLRRKCSFRSGLSRAWLLLGVLLLPTVIGCRRESSDQSFRSAWPAEGERVWVGPEYWANRLQDWRIRDGAAECVVSLPDRNLFLLTAEAGPEQGHLSVRSRFRLLNPGQLKGGENWVGFRIGIKGEFDDYRDSAVHGKGLDLGLTSGGRLFIGSPGSAAGEAVDPSGRILELQADVVPTLDREACSLTLALLSPGSDTPLLALETAGLSPDSLAGGLALVSSFRDVDLGGEVPSVAFEEWRISGDRLDIHKDRAFGPVLFAQYTLSRGILKLTAQMPPVGAMDGPLVLLQVRRDAAWKTVAEAPVDDLSRTATFRVEDWDDTEDIPYRLVFDSSTGSGRTRSVDFEGLIRADPRDKPEIVVAGFTGNNDLGFPNNDLVANVLKHRPDFLFFSGDQIYEAVGGYGIQTEPLDKAVLDYLRKWYLYGWAYGNLLRDRPTVAIPDDHDVYHGNLWGASGKAAALEGTGYERQDSGGYKMPPEWVNMVQRTQTSHLPDPYDPAPVKQGITVYYTEVVCGGVSFAVVEDRKFKSAPRALLPKGKVVNGWAQNPAFDPRREADPQGAELLGDRQLDFLEDWAADWSGGVWLKAVLSQTVFSNVATLPKGSAIDAAVPQLPIPKRGEYPEGDEPVADMDSNGWPPSGRNRALRTMRKAFAFHIAGDQHLGSTIQYGIEDWHDASFALCVPAISNIWPRRWFPSEPGRDRAPGAPRYTGNFEDGFGNKMTVYAVANPYYTGREPARLYDRATGYGIVKFRRPGREIEIASWERDTDPSSPEGKPYSGWPVIIKQTDNYGRRPAGFLPTLDISGLEDPVVQVIEEKTGAIVYTLRIDGRSFRPMVFGPGPHTVRIGEPGTDRMRTLTGLEISPAGTVRVDF